MARLEIKQDLVFEELSPREEIDLALCREEIYLRAIALREKMKAGMVQEKESVIGLDNRGFPFVDDGIDTACFANKRIVAFGEPVPVSMTMGNRIGGKGEGLYLMTFLGFNVPAGFIVTIDACHDYYNGDLTHNGFWNEYNDQINALEIKMGKKFGDRDNPAFVAVRSGGRVSMPGMMNTILNVGINDETIGALEREIGWESAWDAYFKLVREFGINVYGISNEVFEGIQDSIDDKRERVECAKKAIRLKGFSFVEDSREQVKIAMAAVFESARKSEVVEGIVDKFGLRKEMDLLREIFPDEDPYNLYQGFIKFERESMQGTELKKLEVMGLTDNTLGTAVNVVEMCWGNKQTDEPNNRPFSGVMFTSNNETGGEPIITPAFAAQGDIAVGNEAVETMLIRDLPIPDKIKNQLIMSALLLERYLHGCTDVELVYDGEKLWFLQERRANVSALAKFRNLLRSSELAESYFEQLVGNYSPEQISSMLNCPPFTYHFFEDLEKGTPVLEALKKNYIFAIVSRKGDYTKLPFELMMYIGQRILSDRRLLTQITTDEVMSLIIPPLDPQKIEEAESEGRLICRGKSFKSGHAYGVACRDFSQIVNDRNCKYIWVIDDINLLKGMQKLPKNIRGILVKNGSNGSHAGRYAEIYGVPILLGLGKSVARITNEMELTLDASGKRVFCGYIPELKNGEIQDLTEFEAEIIKRWLELKKTDPWLYLLQKEGSGEETGKEDSFLMEVRRKEALAREALLGLESVKAREYGAMNAVIPVEYRESYEILDQEQFNNKELVREKISAILARGMHASFRTCHNPQRPGGGRWAPITNQEELDRFLSCENYYKYGGYPVLVDDSELTEVLIGEFPADKLNPECAKDHCIWTLTISEMGILDVTIKPFTSHFRSLEEADPDDLVSISIGPRLSFSEILENMDIHYGENLDKDDKRVEEFVKGVWDTINEWMRKGLISSIVALQQIFPRIDSNGELLHRTIALEGQYRIGFNRWKNPLIYGIKADVVNNGE